MRIKTIRLTIWSLFLIILLDLVYVQVIRGPYFYRLSTSNRIRVVPIEGQRGRILDRNGVVLADNRVSFDVMVTPKGIQNEDVMFSFLGRILEIDRKTLIERFHSKRYTPFAPVVIAEDISREKAFVLEESKFRFPNLFVYENYRRHYPMGKKGAHVLGYVGKISRAKKERLKGYGYTSQSIIGYLGIEEFYDQYLKGEQGGSQIEVNSRGQQVRLLGIKEPQIGEDVQLTIDGQIQQIATEVLYDKPGAIVVMDVKTGEILGLVSSPSYDPNKFAGKSTQEKSEILTDPASPLLNRSIKGQYPPGSVFKAVLVMGGVDTDAITPETTFECPGYFRMGRRRIRCAHKHNTQNLIEAIAHSCNTYFINLGLLLESETIARYAQLLGLGSLTGVDLPFEEKGLIPSKKQRRATLNRGWYKGDTANLSIGQGEVLVTPLQLVRMMGTIALEGIMVQPHVIKMIGSKEIKIRRPERKVHINEANFKIAKTGLRGTVADSRGTARMLDIPGVVVSGKTGTAQSSGRQKHHAWFVGYTTSEGREIVFCVFLEHGGSSYYAVRVARNFIQKMKTANLL